MYWQENSDNPKPYQPPDDVIDLVFALRARRLPIDHAQALADALKTHLPTDIYQSTGIHAIRSAGSGNGWSRPEEPGAILDLPRRTKLVLRVEKDHVAIIQTSLRGASININGEELIIGDCRERKLSTLPTIFSHSVACKANESEAKFCQRVAGEFRTLQVTVKKMLCGMARSIETTDGPLLTRSLLAANLSPEDAVRLQQFGLGYGKQLGCGLFIPHKGIDAVYATQE